MGPGEMVGTEQAEGSCGWAGRWMGTTGNLLPLPPCWLQPCARGGPALEPYCVAGFRGPWLSSGQGNPLLGWFHHLQFARSVSPLDTSSWKPSRLTPAVSSLPTWAHFARGLQTHPRSVLSLQGERDPGC